MMKNKKITLLEIAKVFLTIGTTGFGGGLAIIAYIQDICVEKKKWLSVDEFSHGIALGQFLGPFAVNAAIFVGYRVRGFAGALTSLISFLAPSVVFVIILTDIYLRFHSIPALQSALNAINPAVIALILNAAFKMGKGKIKNFESIFLMLFAIVLSGFFKVQVMWILFVALFYGFCKARFGNEVKDENS